MKTVAESAFKQSATTEKSIESAITGEPLHTRLDAGVGLGQELDEARTNVPRWVARAMDVLHVEGGVQ